MVAEGREISRIWDDLLQTNLSLEAFRIPAAATINLIAFWRAGRGKARISIFTASLGEVRASTLVMIAR